MSYLTSQGWTGFDFTLSPDAKDVFESAVAGLHCVRYKPIAFASQQTAGTHYSFLCEAQSQDDDASISVVKLRVFQPLDCASEAIEVRPILVSIETIAP